MNMLMKLSKKQQILLFILLLTTLAIISICYQQNFDSNDLFFFRLNKLQLSSISNQKNKQSSSLSQKQTQLDKILINYVKASIGNQSNNNTQIQNANTSPLESGLIVYEEGDSNYFYFEDSKILEELSKSSKFEIREDTIRKNPKDVQKLILKSQNNIQLKEFQYGNWCGPDYGGFESKCKDVCQKNEDEPSDKCIDCRPFIDYVDRVCMDHDFCQQKYQNKVNKENTGFICAYRALNVGQYFQTRCECTYLIIESLRKENLVKNCDSLKCLAYGYAAEKAFNNVLFDCGCYYIEYHRDVYTGKMYPLETQKCVSPSECKSFRGK
ncbi:transmembrane protein, putative (macronuclear) [Tetrahymena thermophila SB210]|uniref:Transmembrane protein, putative n=1 Tax=Tetrahymena thermophila (strain SB210) TaxID=312017 RepID=I7M7P3_TETTS|nr:transmembrane protein, putative [Tetrahymena thermophila SB210]EAR95029.1 transmembrane protein, putative [Tetrahymena thermophila SB210]|eukprot:XP_001015274.1 transmembrane protein, putative [Tetrahymena thermophila SB210]